MNFLTFVFSILLIASFGTFAIQEKMSGGRRLRSTYLGHLKANRKILSSCESESFGNLRSIPKNIEKPPASEKTKKAPEKPKINPACARLNLYPLIQEGREEHPLLYELAAKLIRTFYGAQLFDSKPRAEYHFLDAFLKTAKKALQKDTLFALEKLSFADGMLQPAYYKMLKGTKGPGYPSLLDSIAVEETPSKVCIAHAHPDQISVFFGPKAAAKLFETLHLPEAPLLTTELIQRICSEARAPVFDPAIFDLLDLGRPRHTRSGKKTVIAEDSETHISLKKNIYLSKPG